MKTRRLSILVSLLSLVGTIGLAAERPQMVIQPDEGGSPGAHRVIWSTEPGIRYELQESEDLTNPDGWSTVAGYPSEAAALAQQHTLELDEGADRRFFRVIRLDDQPPEIRRYNPGHGAFGVRRFSAISLDLDDVTGVAPASISMTVGDHGTFTLADDELSYEDGTLVFDLGGDTALGGWGEAVEVTLTVADTLGNAETYAWAFELEHQREEPDNLFVFGSPNAQRAGQRLHGAAAQLAARYGTGPVRRSDSGAEWEIAAVTDDAVVLSYTGDTAPDFRLGQMLANLAPAHVSEIFYRRIDDISDNSGSKELTLQTTEVTLADIMISGTFTLDDTAFHLEFDEDGNLVQHRAFSRDFDLPTIGSDLSGKTLYGEEGFRLWLEEGRFLFHSGIHVSGETSWGRIDRFSARLWGELDVACVPRIEAEGEWSPEIPPVMVWPEWSHWIGGGYVYVQITGSITAHASVHVGASAELEAGYLKNTYMEIGGTYQRNASPRVQWDPTPTFSDDSDRFLSYWIHGEAGVSVWLVPEIRARLYGMAGLRLELTPKVSLGGSATIENNEITQAEWSCTAEMTLNSRLSVIGIDDSILHGFDFTLYERTWGEKYPYEEFAINAHPSSRSVNERRTAYFSVDVTGGRSPTFQWLRNGEPIPGATGRQLRLRNVRANTHEGEYSVRITDEGVSHVSDPATLTVTQPEPSITLWPFGRSFSHSGGEGGFLLTAFRGWMPLDWTAAASDSWITITAGASGWGLLGSVIYMVDEHAGAGRTGAITVSVDGITRDYHIYQEPSPTALTISPEERSHPWGAVDGQTFSISGNIEEWIATSDRSWLRITDVGSGNGGGTVTYSLDTNFSPAPRSGTVRIIGGGITRIFTITQAGTAAGGAGDYLVIDLSGGPSASSYPVSYLSAVPPGGWTDEYKTTKLVLRRIPAGTFTMGSPTNELGRSTNEAQRQVTLTKDFYVGVFQVTQKQWERVMGDWPSYFNNTTYRDSRPVEQRSWNDIRGGTWPGGNAGSGTFMQRISARTGLAFDLPTEAQWEYAARAGTTTALNSGKNLTNTGSCPNMSEVGRYWHNHPGGSSGSSSVSTDGGTATVGSYLPNAWGLYDMHGNVWEWCLDWYTATPPGTTDPVGAAAGSYRVRRGGSWSYSAWLCRSAYRSNSTPSSRYSVIGFRLSRTLPTDAFDLYVHTQPMVNADANVNKTQGSVTWQGRTEEGVWADAEYTYCARFVRMCFGEFTARFSTAIAMYDHFNSLNLVRSGSQPPAAAVVFYDSHAENGYDGHAGIADGQGQCYSVVNRTSGVLLRPVAETFQASYLGYVSAQDFKTFHRW